MNSAAGVILIGLLLVTFNQVRQGTLSTWARSKFFNASDPTPPVERTGRTTIWGQTPAVWGGPAGPANAGGWIRPLDAPTISPFGASRDGGARSHMGTDIGNDSYKGAAVVAARAGVVERVAGDGKCGLRVWVDHGDGWKTLYCHLDAVYVNPGQPVTAGTPLGSCGNTGNARSTPAHVHFETRLNGQAIDPETVVPAHSGAPASGWQAPPVTPQMVA